MTSISQNRQAVILVGGLGTRLGHLVEELPKPMLEIEGKPFLLYLIDFLTHFGYTHFLLLAGYRAEAVDKYFKKNPLLPHLKLKIVTESSLLGTGGALKAAKKHLDKHFLLTNGDSICLFNLNAFSAPLLQRQSLARIAVRPVAANSRYGKIETENSLITGFKDRSFSKDSPGLMNAGLYLMRRRLVDFLPDGKSSLETDLFPKLAKGRHLESFVIEEPSFFIDIGIPEDLVLARSLLIQNMREALL